MGAGHARWTLGALAIVCVFALGCGAQDEGSAGGNAADCGSQFLSYAKSGPDRCGDAATASFYNQITGAPESFDDWKASRCLSDDFDHVTLKYFNEADLNLGRELHMNKCSSSGVISAYVANFGEGGQSLSAGVHAITAGDSPVAVAMDFIETRAPSPEYAVQFYVYTSGGPGGARIGTGLQFDSEGTKLSPFACTVCHGGKYDPAVGLVRGASFLPLLKEGLYFLKNDAIEDRLRRMNALIEETSSLSAVRTLIETAYPEGVQKAGAVYQEGRLPPAWQGAEDLYRKLAFPYCINCHAAHADEPFNGPADMPPAKLRFACKGSGITMPQSEVGHVALITDNAAYQLLQCP